MYFHIWSINCQKTKCNGFIKICVVNDSHIKQINQLPLSHNPFKALHILVLALVDSFMDMQLISTSRNALVKRTHEMISAEVTIRCHRHCENYNAELIDLYMWMLYRVYQTKCPHFSESLLNKPSTSVQATCLAYNKIWWSLFI